MAKQVACSMQVTLSNHLVVELPVCLRSARRQAVIGQHLGVARGRKGERERGGGGAQMCLEKMFVQFISHGTHRYTKISTDNQASLWDVLIDVVNVVMCISAL